MKQLKLAVIALFTLVTVSSVNAQDSNNPWAFSLGANVIDFRINKGFENISKDYLGTTDWNIIKSISRFSVERYLDKGFTLQGAFSLNELKTLNAKDDIDAKYYALEINAKYDLNNLIGDTSWFDPYVLLGGAYVYTDYQANDLKEGMLNIGYGFNVWFNENIGANFQSVARRNFADKVADHFPTLFRSSI